MMSATTLVSVIIPVYNSSDYLSRCIESIVNQTHQNLDIVIVDDGSTDDSGRISDFYAEKDKRIHVVHQGNHGVSVARIVGLEKSKGDYVMFVDSDDYIDENMVDRLLTEINENRVDVAVCQLYDVYGNSKKKNIRPIRGTFHSDDFPGLLASDFLFDKVEMRSGFFLYLCGKLFKRSVLEDSSMQVALGIHYGEDMLVVIDLFKHHIDSVTIIEDCLYYYYHHPAQVSAQSIKTRWPEYVIIWEKLFYLYDKEKYFSEQLSARIAYYLYKSAKQIMEEGNSKQDCLGFLGRMRGEDIVDKLLFRNKRIFSLLGSRSMNLFLFLMKYRLFRCVYAGYRIKNN